MGLAVERLEVGFDMVVAELVESVEVGMAEAALLEVVRLEAVLVAELEEVGMVELLGV